MRITASIHQPNFIPWLGFFYKIIKSDIFIILDDVQFIKRSYINRNFIKTSNGAKKITVPIHQKGKYQQNINECVLFEYEKFCQKFISTININYSRTKFFDVYFDELENLIKKNYYLLSDLNTALIKWFLEKLNIKTILKKSSDFPDSNKTSTEKLIYICKNVGADIYLSGHGGENYQDPNMFQKNNITLQITNFIHPVYYQLYGDFVPNLSILDLLFNCGSNSKNIIEKSYK